VIHWSSVTGSSGRCCTSRLSGREILASQAEWGTWLLRGPPARCLLKGWRPPRSGDGARAAFTLALGLMPGP